VAEAEVELARGPHGFPPVLVWAGWLSAPGTWFIALRLGWEATVLTAREGPQMVGFSILHRWPLVVLPAMASVFVAYLFAFFALCWVVFLLLQREGIRRSVWIELTAILLPLVLLHLTAWISG
jgi:hypothetical protein